MASTKIVVAAIDFGTTFSGYAFSFAHDYENDPLKIQTNHWIGGGHLSLKAPTSILFSPDKRFHSFGYEAEDKYSDLAEEDMHSDWYFFRRFKMILHQNKVLSRKTLLLEVNRKPLAALTVFSEAIKYLKKNLTETIFMRMTGFEESDIHWVLTVPAIWTDAAKQFMREAALQAGINGECLELVLEPEAASAFCKCLPVERLKGGQSMTFDCFLPGTCYIVLDLGGGTVDITVHSVQQDGSLSEIAKASGGAWGGTQVDDAYLGCLAEMFGTKVIETFQEEHTGDFLDMMRDFEVKKRAISEEKEGNIVLRIPASFAETYKSLNSNPISKHIFKGRFAEITQLKRDKLNINVDVFKQFFASSIANTIEHVKRILAENEYSNISTILLVGGFAESEIVQQRIREAFQNKRVIVPSESGLSVLKGAVLLGHDPRIMKSRISKYTYGTEVINRFELGHPEKYKVFENEEFRCRYIFKTFVRAGEAVPVGTVVENHYISDTFDVKEGLGLYASTEENPQYVTEESCFKIGTVKFENPLERYKLEMHFGETEILLKFIFADGKRKTETVNFLCD
ncbi:heat shock 70 kDa protein 12A-like [Mercenaria mercenaria]|uniref:heat shock 70 kDa protein 12A-like n=1 Tax=Mercenaria mercenaria TaxID=6596 RepID=UPI00234FB310|nr:heat shock 70 kDa protein 12A-like [Mercenaria mercenaria]